MCDVICSYIGKCISYGTRCGTCQNNTGKRDYYRPEPYPYYPYTWPWITTTGTQDDGDHYEIWCTST